MARVYSPSSYDDHFCLRPPALLWVAAVYLSRAIVLLVASDLVSLARVDNNVVTLLRGAVSIYALVPSLVAAPVLFALVSRGPASNSLVRWIWARGRAILTFAAIFDCAVSVAASGIIGGDAADLSAGLLLAAVFDLYFLVYILATRRVRDVFADFPPPEPAGKRRR